MKIATKKIEELTDHERGTWRRLQEESGHFQSPYFRPEFSECVSSVRTDVEVAIGEKDGRLVCFFPFQRAKVNAALPVGANMNDFQGWVADLSVDIDPSQVLQGAGLRTWQFNHLIAALPGFTPYYYQKDVSPFMNVSGGLDDYKQRLAKGGQSELKQVMRKTRKLWREHEDVRFVIDCRDQAVFDQLLAWKSEQYLRTSGADVFARGWTRTLLEQVCARTETAFSGLVTALFVGDQLIAGHIGMRSRHVLHWWFPVYDVEWSAYSPGRILLTEIVKASPELGITHIDLGKDMSTYKRHAMTGAIDLAIGVLDPNPLTRHARALSRRAWRDTKAWLKTTPLSEPLKKPANFFYRRKVSGA